MKKDVPPARRRRRNLPKRGDDDGEPPLLLGSREKLERGFCADLEQSLRTAFGTGADSHSCHICFLQNSPLRRVQNIDLRKAFGAFQDCESSREPELRSSLHPGSIRGVLAASPSKRAGSPEPARRGEGLAASLLWSWDGKTEALGPQNEVTGGAWGVLVFQATDIWILHIYVLHGCVPPKAQ